MTRRSKHREQQGAVARRKPDREVSWIKASNDVSGVWRPGPAASLKDTRSRCLVRRVARS